MAKKRPQDDYGLRKIPSDHKKRGEDKFDKGEYSDQQQAVVFRSDDELKNYIIDIINKKSPSLLNYASIDIKNGDIYIFGNVKTLYDKDLFLKTINEVAPLKIHDQLKVKPLINLYDTRLANKIAEVMGKEKTEIKEIVDYNFRVKGNTVYFKVHLNKDNAEAKRKIFETLSKIEGVKSIVISHAFNSLNTPKEEKIEGEIKKIILDRKTLNLNKIKIYVIDSIAFIDGEVESYEDMLYLEEKVSQIDNLKKLFSQLVVAF